MDESLWHTCLSKTQMLAPGAICRICDRHLTDACEYCRDYDAFAYKGWASKEVNALSLGTRRALITWAFSKLSALQQWADGDEE